MVPREAGRGRSFMGAGQYYLHDKGASTSERVGFTHTENIPTNDPHKAMKWMAWTAINAEDLKRESGGATWGDCEKPVYTFSLAWHPEEQPKKWEMIAAGRRALMELGLQDHETVMASHTDREHAHMHLIVNLVHPETGKASRLSYSRLKLSDWAEDYERQRGNIYCDQRVENNAKRKQGEKVKYREPELDIKTRISELYQQSDSAKAFQAALQAEGFQLAQGKRIVLLDHEGKIHSLYRQIDGVKARDIRERLAEIELPDVDEVRGRVEEEAGQAEQETKPQPESPGENSKPIGSQTQGTAPPNFDRDQQDRDWQESIIDAAIHADQQKRAKNKASSAETFEVSPARLNALQDRQHAELGRFYTERAQDRRKLDFTLDQQYGVHERQLRSDVSHLDDVLTNSSRLRVWWLKLTSQIPRNAEEELSNMRQSLDNVEWRQDEARQALEDRTAQQSAAIEARHRQENEALRTQMALPTLPSPYHDSTPEHRDDEDIGPSFEY